VNREVSLSMLKDLLATSNDGARGFALATKDNREPAVAGLFKDAEDSCRAAAVELENEVRLLGGVLEEGGADKAPMYRGWTSFKAVPISRDTKQILEECERGGDYALSRYQAALELDLPEAARVLVERQQQCVIAIHRRLLLARNRSAYTEIPRDWVQE